MARLTSRDGTVEHAVTTRERWERERRELLEAEKALFRAHDELKRRRRALPWVLVDKPYPFDGPGGRVDLAQLFGSARQLVVYHFMFDPGANAGCPHCSFWADHFDGPQWHLAQRSTRLVAVSRAPWPTLQGFQQRMGWRFPWYSSGAGDFNFDFGASFHRDQVVAGTARYNYEPVPTDATWMADREGASAFYRDEGGAVYHTYSTFARGIDLLNATYNVLDLTALGRDEDPRATQSWVRHHDRYGASG